MDTSSQGLGKIVIVSSSYPASLWNGIGRLTTSLARGLSEKGYDVNVITYSKEASSSLKKDGNVFVNYLSCGAAQKSTTLVHESVEGWQHAVSNAFQFRHRNTDLVLVIDSTGYKPTREALPNAKIIGISNMLLNYYGWFTPLRDKDLEVKFLSEEKEFITGSNALLVNNNSAKQKIQSMFGVNAELMTVGINPLVTAAAEKQAGLVVFAGKLTGDKGLERIIRVMPQLPWLKLAVAGSGSVEGLKHITMLADKLRVTNRLNLLGWMQTEDVYKWYAKSEMAVVPCLNELLGYAALDPMALGTPVIVSQSNSLPEIVADAEDGMVFGNLDELTFALDELHHQTQLREQFTKNAQEKIRTGRSAEAMIESVAKWL